MSPHALRTEVEAPLGVITLTESKRRNPLSTSTMRELISAFGELDRDANVRAIILAAEGPAFSAGHDLHEMTAGEGLEFYRGVFELCTQLMLTIPSLQKPVIAEVDGIATAAGCQLVAACDLAVASERATFATPGVKIGLFCSTPMVELTRAIGRKRALEMLLTGRAIDARTAADWGLINRVVGAEALREATRELALQIASASPLTVGLGKQAFYAQIDLDRSQAYGHAKEVMSRNAVAADAQEGMMAFLEKRKPTWRGE